MTRIFATIIFLAYVRTCIPAQLTPPNSFPHAWPGQPTGPLSTEWQKYFEVQNPIPELTGLELPRSFAGNIPVNRADNPNNTLFFWGFERQGVHGSLTAPAHANNSEPWVIWLQGGPGVSGMLGLYAENGPIHIMSNGSWVSNPFSWQTLADTIWIDQPVGTGFSTAESEGYITDEDQMAEDFIGFLTNLISVFPNLATRPLYLTGESYAGVFIPYIVKHIFAQLEPPVNLQKVAIGNGALGAFTTIKQLPVLNILETYPAIIGYDQDVFNYFREQHHLCGFDLNLTYPQTGGNFPTLHRRPGLRAQLHTAMAETRVTASSWREAIATEYEHRVRMNPTMKRADYLERKDAALFQWKRDISGRPNGTIDPWYHCDIFDEMRDYAVNYTFPWSSGGFNDYDIADATHPEPSRDAKPFFNSPDVRAALHAPMSKNWSRGFDYPFGSDNNSNGNKHGDPSVEPMAFLTPLFASASERNISFVFYSGNDDAQFPHRGTEVVIQNITFGGVQGFARKPATPWFDDDGNAAGIVHQERGLTYVLFTGAGHLVPQWKPAQALVFLREFVLGSNPNGTFVDSGAGQVAGGEDQTLAGDFLPGGNEIYYGSAKTEGTSTIPSATIAAWESFIATATLDAVVSSSATSGSTGSTTSAIAALRDTSTCIAIFVAGLLSMCLLL